MSKQTQTVSNKRKKEEIKSTTPTKKKKTIQKKLFYLLLEIQEYHGGTRGMTLGLYSSIEEAKAAWFEQKRDDVICSHEQFDDEKIPTDKQVEKLSTIKGKIVPLKLDQKPSNWACHGTEIDLT